MILYHGNGLDFLAYLPAHSVDLLLLDTPFGTTKSKVDKRLNLDRMWRESKRVIKPNCAIIHFAQEPYSAQLITSHERGYKHKWIWEKSQAGNFATAKYGPLSVDEEILIFTAKGERVNYYPIMRQGKERKKGNYNPNSNSGRGYGGLPSLPSDYKPSDQYYPRSVLRFPVVTRSKSLGPHEKPVELLDYLIRTYSRPGALIVDFTMGTGASGEAAYKAGRQYLGAELDSDTFLIAQNRLICLQSQS